MYAASGVGAALSCPIKLGAKATEAVKSGSSDGSSSASLYFACNTLVNTGGKVDKAVLTALNAALKKDDSLRSLGLAFHVASLVTGKDFYCKSAATPKLLQLAHVNPS